VYRAQRQHDFTVRFDDFAICRYPTDASTKHDLGGRILERTAAGVRPTSGGRALAERSRKLLGEYDSTLAEARRLVRGEYERLRIGYPSHRQDKNFWMSRWLACGGRIRNPK